MTPKRRAGRQGSGRRQKSRRLPRGVGFAHVPAQLRTVGRGQALRGCSRLYMLAPRRARGGASLAELQGSLPRVPKAEGASSPRRRGAEHGALSSSRRLALSRGRHARPGLPPLWKRQGVALRRAGPGTHCTQPAPDSPTGGARRVLLAGGCRFAVGFSELSRSARVSSTERPSRASPIAPEVPRRAPPPPALANRVTSALEFKTPSRRRGTIRRSENGRKRPKGGKPAIARAAVGVVDSQVTPAAQSRSRAPWSGNSACSFLTCFTQISTILTTTPPPF